MSLSCCSMGIVLSNYIYMLKYRSRSLSENGDDKVDQCKTPIKKSLASSNQENYLISGWKWLIYLQCVKNYRDFFFVLWSKYVNKVKNMRIEKNRTNTPTKMTTFVVIVVAGGVSFSVKWQQHLAAMTDWLADWTTRLDETNE